MKVIRGRKALVTGAAGGIGRAIALALAKEGADLFLIDIDRAKLDEVARETRACGVEVITRICDLAEPAQISAAVKALLSTWGGLNILVNNAGVTYRGNMHLMSDEFWNRMMAINLLAPMQLVRELLPALLTAEDAHVLNVSSVLGLVPGRKVTGYQTTKYGLVGFTKGLNIEYYCPTFAATAFCPGFVRTTMIEDYPTGDLGKQPKLPPWWLCTTPERVAFAAIKAIRRRSALVVITPLARALWAAERTSPRFVDWLFREGWRRRGKVQIEEDAPVNRRSSLQPHSD
jgi:3-oxoacyl-[acyl-carrier protein] reductase